MIECVIAFIDGKSAVEKLARSVLATTLASFAATVMAVPPGWIDTSKSDLNVTLGEVSQAPPGYLSVVGPKERGQRKTGTHQDAILQFQYRGPSTRGSKLASGGFVRQIGLKMRTENTCNLLYVMWRIEPTEQIVVTIKSNPGQTRHRDCGAKGYVPVARIPLSDFAITATNRAFHRLRARVDESDGAFRCSVDVDGQTIWTGTLDAQIIAPIDGPVGFRSDNGSFKFKLLVPDSGASPRNPESAVAPALIEATSTGQ